jgi:hypothetical protein
MKGRGDLLIEDVRKIYFEIELPLNHYSRHVNIIRWPDDSVFIEQNSLRLANVSSEFIPVPTDFPR